MENKTRNRILMVLFLGVLMGALDIAIIGPALPAIGTAFNVDERGLAWIFTIYVFFSLLGSPVMANLSDRYGRRSIYVLNISLFAVGSLMVAFSPNFAVLLLGRAIQGLGSGGIFPVASAVIGDTFPEEKRGGALGLIGAVFGLAFLIGPILGGILLLISWHWLFLINLPIALLVIGLSLRELPTTGAKSTHPFDSVGMVVLAILLGGLTIGISQITTSDLVASLASVEVWPFLLVALIALPLFIWLEQRAADPIIRPSLLGTRQLILANALSVGAGLGEAATVFLPALAVAAFKVNESTASFLILPIVLAMAVGSPLAGRMLDRYGSKAVILGGTSLLTLGMFLLGLFGQVFWLYIVSGIIIGIGLGGLLGAPLRYIMLNEASKQDRAAAQGMITVFTGLGQLFSGALVGAIAVSHTQDGEAGGYTLAYLCVGFVSVVLLLLAFGLKNRSQERSTVPTGTKQAPNLVINPES
ncbi:MAG: MFS transporter [Chloroflexota bacterium]|nr:MFS transporter [Chloroflexota bacterium]